jgi:hypothetical protein
MDAAGKKGIGGFILPGNGSHFPAYNKIIIYFSAHVQYSQRDAYINVKEMLAVLVALNKWASLLKNCRLVLLCDNMAVISGLR